MSVRSLEEEIVAAGGPSKFKVWLTWHRDDVASYCEQGDKRFKHIEMPAAFYAASQFDLVQKYGDLIGVSTLCSYSANVRGLISLAMIDESRLAYGDQVELVWGEPNGGSASPGVEPHSQTTIRATVTERPFPTEK